MADVKSNRGLKVGKVGFVNTMPIFHPLESGAVPHDFQIVEGTPVALNTLLAAGKLDMGLVSSVEYARRFEEYLLLPNLSISCKSQVRSVLLLSRVPLPDLDGREILLTPKSHTSVALLRLLLACRFAASPRYRVADYHLSPSGWPDKAAAVLAIGDDALWLSRSPGIVLALDLGAAWHEWTGHSFVFAVWALRREALAQKDGAVHRAFATLVAAKEYGLRHPEEIAAAAVRRSGLPERECLEYLQNIEYDLDRDKQAGLKLFFDLLLETGELSRRVPLSFLPDAGQTD